MERIKEMREMRSTRLAPTNLLALPFLKPSGFGGFNSGSGLGFFKPAGLGSGGQKSQNPPEPTRAHP
jgi:hypothetical protein